MQETQNFTQRQQQAIDQTDHSPARWADDMDRPDAVPEPAEPELQMRKPQSKSKLQTTDLTYREQGSVKPGPGKQVVQLRNAEVRKLAADGFTCLFQQDNPKSEYKGKQINKSHVRYEQYKGVVSVHVPQVLEAWG